MTDRGYERISLDNERSGSIVKQTTRLDKFGDNVVHYTDESVSGAKVRFADRPAGSRLLADLQKGDRVLVTKIDRAARNVRDLLGLVELIEAAGASIVFVDQNLDTAGAMGRFMLTLLGAVAELEAAIVSERVRETRESFRTEGRFGGGPIPFGFVTVPNPAGRGVVLRTSADAELVRDVIERVQQGEAQRALAPLLGLGEPGFSRYLRNPVLAGIRPGTASDVDPEAAILTLVEWRSLQEYLDRPAKAWTRTDGYGGALACGVCGSRLYYGRNTRYPDSSVYRCGRRQHAPGQPAVAVVRRLADEHIETEFLRAFGSLPVLEETIVSASAVRDEAIARAQLELDAVRRAQDLATTEEEDDQLAAAFRKARATLRTAEALPEDTTRELHPTGQTFAQVWAAGDDDTRTALLLRVGPWLVEPGRMPVDQKVRRDETAQDYLAGQTD